MNFISRGLNAYIIRPAITYGKGDNGFPTTLAKMVKRRILFLPRKDIKIHLLDVNKLSEVCLNILTNNNPVNKIFTIADQTPVKLKEIVNIIHQYYHKTNYPSFLTIPNSVYNTCTYLFQALRSEKWSVRTRLISESWYYDITETVSSLQFQPANTKREFIQFLNGLN